MSWPAEPDFFLPVPNEQPSQGDIVPVPTTTLWSLAGRGSVVGIPTLPQIGSATRGVIWTSPRGDNANYLTHTTRRGVGIVVSHDCALEKQFNELVIQLQQEGISLEEAQQIASARNDLDETLLVAPLVDIEELPKAYHAGIQQRIGYLPLPTVKGLEQLSLVADLSQITTVDWRVLGPAYASLGEPGIARLRFKLAEMFAYRNISTLAEISAIIGHRVLNAQVVEKSKKKSILALHLEDGSQKVLEIRTPDADESDTSEVVRLPGTRRRLPLMGPLESPRKTELLRRITRKIFRR